MLTAAGAHRVPDGDGSGGELGHAPGSPARFRPSLMTIMPWLVP